MKTTLIIPNRVFRDLKRRAAERNETVSALVTEYLVLGLRESHKPQRSFHFPTFKMGPPKLDVADRQALYEVLDGERDAHLYAGLRRGD